MCPNLREPHNRTKLCKMSMELSSFWRVSAMISFPVAACHCLQRTHTKVSNRTFWKKRETFPDFWAFWADVRHHEQQKENGKKRGGFAVCRMYIIYDDCCFHVLWNWDKDWRRETILLIFEAEIVRYISSKTTFQTLSKKFDVTEDQEEENIHGRLLWAWYTSPEAIEGNKLIRCWTCSISTRAFPYRDNHHKLLQH